MAKISSAFRDSLDRSLPKLVSGPGYSVAVWSRGAVRYQEPEGRTITMFSDLILRDDEPIRGGWIARLFRRLNKYCLGVYIEEPLRWDNDDVTVIDPRHEEEILERVEAALRERTHCYRIDRGPNRQHSESTPPPIGSHSGVGS